MTFAVAIRRLDDWINPIAVKEMRQAVNALSIEWTLIVFLLVQLAIAAMALLFGDEHRRSFVEGRSVFMGHLGVLLATCLFYVPLSTAIRFSSEKAEQNLDLLFITTLKPVQIIAGKTLTAMILMLLFFSAATPFLTLTYLLRGLDIPSIFFLLAVDFLVVSGCVQLAILLACVPRKVLRREFVLPVGLAVLVVVSFVMMNVSSRFLIAGVGSGMGSLDFWGPALIVAAFAILVMGLLFILSVTLITPRSANRALGLRIYLLFIWLISGTVMGIWSFVSGDSDPVQAWKLGMTILFSVNLFVSICERQELGPRVLREVPTKKILRLPAFLLYSGAAGGVCYSIVMMAGTIIMTGLFLTIVPPPALKWSVGTVDYNAIATAITLYALGYSLTALTIRRILFAHSRRSGIMIEIILTLLMAAMGLPAIIGNVLHSQLRDMVPPAWYCGNPFAFFWHKEELLGYMPVIGIWVTVALLVTLPWLMKQFLLFKRAAPVEMNITGASDE